MFFDIFDLPQCFSSYFHCWSVFLVTKMYKKRCYLHFQCPVTLFCISHQPSFSRTSDDKFLKNRSSEDVKFYVDSGEKIIGRLPAIILTQIENTSYSRIGNYCSIFYGISFRSEKWSIGSRVQAVVLKSYASIYDFDLAVRY